MNIKKRSQATNEEGFAAIIVTLIIMTIVVLVTIGFFAVVNREQRATIDRQLNTQAFYAAETGVNDAATMLVNGEIDDINSCEEFRSSALNAKKQISQDDATVEYTCVLIERAPDNLAYDSVKTEQPTVARIQAVDENGDRVGLASLTISWQSENLPDTPTFGAGSDFPDNWNYAAPVLRTSLTPYEPNSISRDRLIEHTATNFLRPNDNSGTTSQAISFGNPTVQDGSSQVDQGEITRARCSTGHEPKFCSVTLDLSGTPFTSPNYNFLLTLRALYHNADVMVTGQAAGGGDVLFEDQQAVIDATGRASDVLQRIQVRVPLHEQYDRPGFGIETSKGGGICKLYDIYPGGGTGGC